MASAVSDKRFLSIIWISTLVLVLVTPAATGLVGLIIAMLLLLATGLYLTVRHGPKIWIGDRFSQMLVAASALILISFLVTSRQPSDLAFLANFLGILVGPPLLFLSRRFSGLEWTKRIVIMAACGAGFTFLVAVWDIVIRSGPRAEGFYLGGANQFGQFTLLYGAICLGGLMLWREPLMRAILVAAVAASAIAIFWSGSRGVMLAALPTAAVAAGFAVIGRFDVKRILGVGLMALVLVFGTLWAANMSNVASDRMFGAFGQIQEIIETGRSAEPSLQVRLHLYRSGWESFVSAPLFGVGWMKSLEDGNALVQTDMSLPDSLRLNFYPLLHNDIIGFGASMGLFGLVAFALLVAAPWLGVGSKDELRRFRVYLLICMVCIFHVFALNDVSLTVGAGLMAYMVMAALICGTFTNQPHAADQTPT